MNGLSLKSLTPHIIAVLVFISITIAYFSPLIEGKVIRQPDVVNFKGMSKEIADYREQYKKEPLWTNSMFGGMPAYQISVKYPNNLIRPLNSVLGVGIPHPATIIFLCMLGFYLLLGTFHVAPLLAAGGAIAFGFSSYFIILIEAGHNPKGYAIAYMAPIVAGIFLAYRGKPWIGAALAGFSLSLQLAMNHLQITYYLAMLIAFIGVGELVRHIVAGELKKFILPSVLLLIGAALAIGPNITNLMVTQEYGKYSTRGPSELTDNKENKTSGLDKDYATQWSYGIGETFTLMIPNFKGGQSQVIGDNKSALEKVDPDFRQYISNFNQYWGDQPFTSGPVYIGAIICFLFLLGMFILKDHLKWYLLGAVILTVMLSWGKNFMGLTDFFMDHVPGYNKFRAVSMILVIAEFCLPLIAILTVKYLLENPAIVKEQQKKLFMAFGFTGGLCLLFYLLPQTFQDFFAANEYENVTRQLKESKASPEQISLFMDGVLNARVAIFKADAIRSFFFILLAAGLIYAYIAKPFNKSYLMLGLTLLIFIDLWSVDKRYLNKDNFVSKSVMEVPYEPTAADQQILADKDINFRVINTAVSTFNDASTSYFHKSIGGYHGAKLKRFQEVVERHISQNNMQVLNMLNTRYFIMKPGQEGEPMAQRNPGALGNAWFVQHAKMVDNADAEIDALSKFNPRDTLIVDKRYADLVKKKDWQRDSADVIKHTSYKADELLYSYNISGERLTVFSEIFYDKGWNAYIDDQLVPHFRVNYLLRGMVLPAGKHNLAFRFEPEAYQKGESIALAGSFALFAFAALCIFMQLKSSGKREGEEGQKA